VDYATREPDGSVWVDDTTDVNRIFSFDLSYKKGAMLLRMLRWKLGDSFFFKGIRQYLSDSSLQYNFARTKDLQRNLEKVSGQSLTNFFNQWLYGKGFPSFAVQWNWSKNKLQLQIKQTTSNASVPLFSTPLQLRFANDSRQQDTIININQNITQLSLPLGFNPDTVLIDPMQYIISKNNISKRVENVILTDDNNRIILYPNPANNVLYIHIPATDSSLSQTIIITAASGAVVYKNTFANITQNTIALPVAQLAKGVYFVTIQNANNNISKNKFIKQ
ncbi:MAG: T9SS type A sorting domain-containing protein, partial [Bacteroidota bacterium]|nr:T9SS type A sorting domain-containing protein [Bacteroidota bacterium]